MTKPDVNQIFANPDGQHIENSCVALTPIRRYVVREVNRALSPEERYRVLNTLTGNALPRSFSSRNGYRRYAKSLNVQLTIQQWMQANLGPDYVVRRPVDDENIIEIEKADSGKTARIAIGVAFAPR